MLEPLDDPYTRLLRPDDYSVMKSSNSGSLSGVGLQLGHHNDEDSVVVIAALEDHPPLTLAWSAAPPCWR